MLSDFNLTEYMNRGILDLVKSALKSSYKNPREIVFLLQYMLKSRHNRLIRSRYEKSGTHIPPFLIASITSNCNLYCSGCYARANRPCAEKPPQNELDAGHWRQLFAEAKKLGVAFILLAGGEPLTRRDVVECASGFKSIVFPVFTNGTMMDEKYVGLFNRNRNLVPVLSIEGTREQTDARRGKGTYDAVRTAMKKLAGNRILYGVSVTVTTENVKTVSDDEFISDLRRGGCRVAFFVEYVPVTPLSRRLAPSDKERAFLEERLHALRVVFGDMIFLSFPGDEKHTGGCLAAGRGFFHINAAGGAEPCPFSPFSDRNLSGCSLLEALSSPLFRKLERSGMLLGEHDGGCLLFEKEDELKKLHTEQ